jgi:DNA-binding transcriptional LysR family regulator
VRADLGTTVWPLRGEHGGVQPVVVDGRFRCNSHALAYAAVLAGLGIAIFPEFACAADVRRRHLVAVLDDWRIDVGQVWLVHPTQRFASAALQRFLALATEQLGAAPWA